MSVRWVLGRERAASGVRPESGLGHSCLPWILPLQVREEAAQVANDNALDYGGLHGVPQDGVGAGAGGHTALVLGGRPIRCRQALESGSFGV